MRPSKHQALGTKFPVVTVCFGQWTIQLNATLSEAISQTFDALDVFPIPQELKNAVLAERNHAR